MSDNRQLLAEYAEGSEPAFREFVDRYLPLVYSTALRLVNGDAHFAEDIAQTVFLDAAREAKSLSNHPQLAGWLHRHTCYVASNSLRSKRRRENREREAAQMSPTEHEADFADAARILDAAINQLGSTDRAAILLRFFAGLDFRAVGQAIGANEAAAQKRVRRALEKLNRLLTKNGVTFSAIDLGAALATHAINTAPIGLGASIATNVLLAAPESASAISLIKLMTLSKSKAAAVALLIVASVTAPTLLNRSASANIARMEKIASAQTAQLLSLADEKTRLSAELRNFDQTTAREGAELSSLKNEANTLRAAAEQQKSLRAQIHQLSLQREGGNGTSWQNAEMWRAKGNRIKGWSKALFAYASAHDGQLPASLEDAASFLPKDFAKGPLPPSEEYELLYRGSLQTLTNLNPDAPFIILRERKLSPSVHFFDKYYKKMARYEIHANGSDSWGSVEPGQLDSEFSSFEKEHLVPDGVQ
ncbi:MAG TPA: sigma-70 family RNA polymerase sigma factor [Verrucomicrobiae bacterium]|nr:sigma-70 family RNA polymerase sigma factor [Verrucomicrobiae bacterium]